MIPHAPLNIHLAASRFEAALNDPGRAQAELLRRILGAHAATRYGRQHGFASVRDLDDYRRSVPMVTFEAVERHVADMRSGEPDVLVSGQPIYFAQTSGTSATPKLIPFSSHVPGEQASSVGNMLAALERDHPGATARSLTILGKFREGQTAAGVTIGSASGFTRNAMRCHPFFNLVPEPICELDEFEARYYALLRIALQTPLRTIFTFNPSTILTMFAKAVEFADPLAHDLERGTLAAGPATSLAQAVEALEPHLQRRPDIARTLRETVTRDARFDPARFWPDLRLLQVWKGGMCALYLRELRESCPGCAIRSMPSSATEGTMFMALADDWVGGVPELTATVIELLPEEADAGGATIAMHELPELADGQGYRPVLTNHRGLYRYLMEDVFYVEGWHRGVPIMRFSHRHGMTSSLTGEKLTEVQVLAALDSAASSAGVDVSEAQLAPEWGSPPRYLLLVQPRRPAGRAALRALLIAFENTLAGSNPEYDHKRRSGRLAPPQLLVVGREVFERMRTDMTSGRSDAQAKISRLRRDVLARDTLEVDAVVTLREEDQA